MSNGFKLKEFRSRYKAEISYNEGDETMQQVDQRSSGCHITGSVKGQVGWSFEQTNLVKDVCPQQSWTRSSLKVPSNLNIYVILWFQDLSCPAPQSSLHNSLKFEMKNSLVYLPSMASVPLTK